MREFWDKDRLYSTLRRYVDFTTRRSYRRITVEGALPPDTDGIATIYAPNHTNTLMDALVVLQLRRGGTLFGARADVFRKPVIARILHFLKRHAGHRLQYLVVAHIWNGLMFVQTANIQQSCQI